tara:strand:+ start:2111 stop:2785 length:675 start_codon:yes stop_codon:yes gene_type:complete
MIHNFSNILYILYLYINNSHLKYIIKLSYTNKNILNHFKNNIIHYIQNINTKHYILYHNIFKFKITLKYYFIINPNIIYLQKLYLLDIHNSVNFHLKRQINILQKQKKYNTINPLIINILFYSNNHYILNTLFTLSKINNKIRQQYTYLLNNYFITFYNNHIYNYHHLKIFEQFLCISPNNNAYLLFQLKNNKYIDTESKKLINKYIYKKKYITYLKLNHGIIL